MNIAHKDVAIPCGAIALHGELQIPEAPRGLILFVHGSGSSRLSSRNRLVAERLNEQGFATLLFDLLSPDEEKHVDLRFDIPLLTRRVSDATNWTGAQPELRDLPLGYFGASTGAAAALAASVGHKNRVHAVVSRGGRPDLADGALETVSAPTLLIVGSLDAMVIDLNEQAMRKMNCETKLEIVEGATHLFEEPGKLEVVSQLAGNWFVSHLPRSAS